MDAVKRRHPFTSGEASSGTNSKKKARFARKQTFKFNRKARLIVRNLSFKTTEESLTKYYEPYGEIKEVTLLKKQSGELVGCGFVQFNNTQEAAQALLKTNAQKFLGRPIHVDWAVAKDAYVRHLVNQNVDNENDQETIEPKSEPEDEEEVDNETATISTEEIEIKDEVKSENESEEENSTDSESNSDSTESDESDDKDDVKFDQNDEEDNESKKKSANDAEDGRTVFLKNVPFEATQQQLRQRMEQFGPTVYALVVMDKMTEHSKGTAFVRFQDAEDAERCLASGTELTLLGQVLDPHPALSRTQAQVKGQKGKTPVKDNRNLYLIKEGVILAGTKAAQGVSATDMAKRLQLELSKSQMLRNLNRFVSKFRLTIHNLPETYDDARLRALCAEKGANVKEARVMRENRPSPGNPVGKSKGFGFVSFASHEHAIETLRHLNNNPTVFAKQNRPIVAFSIEDKAAINAKQKRLQKSLNKNPTSKHYDMRQDDNSKSKPQQKTFDKNQNKKNIFKNNKRPFQKKQDIQPNVAETEHTFSGVTAKPGKQKMRNRFNLKTQAKIHADTLKHDKFKLKTMKKTLVERQKDHIRQPRQVQNTNAKNKFKNVRKTEDGNLSKLIGQYKNKLQSVGGNNLQKSKWYE